MRPTCATLGGPLFSSSLLLLSTALHPVHAEIPSGTPVEQAMTVDVTAGGFDSLTGFAELLVPPRIDLPSVFVEGLTCDIVRIWNMWVGLDVDTVEITPSNGRIDIVATIDVNVNLRSDPFDMTVWSICFIPDSCTGWVRTRPLVVDTYIEMRKSPTTGLIESRSGPVNVNYALNPSDIVIEDCGTVDFINGLLWVAGTSLEEIFVGEIQTAIDDAVGGLTGELDTVLNDAFAQMVLSEEVELDAGLFATLDLAADDIRINEDGMRLIWSGGMSVPDVARCVQPFDVGGSTETPSGLPPIGARGEHFAAFLSDEFTDQAMYAIWRAGLLCQEIGEEVSQDIGLPFDTTLLPLFVGSAFQDSDLFPSAQPITLVTVPRKPPVLDLQRSKGAGVAIDDFGLSIYTELDGRQARLVELLMDVNVGASTSFDGPTGVLGFDLDLTGSEGIPSLIADVTHNEFAPGQEDIMSAALAGLMESTLVTALVDSLLGDALGLALPSYCAFGVTSLGSGPTGPARDWFGTTMQSGDVEYVSLGGCVGDSSGCTGDTGAGGCTDSSGCSTEEALGCTTGATGDTAVGCDPEACDPAACAGDLGGQSIEQDLCGCSISTGMQSKLMVLGLAGVLVGIRRRRRR